jgi:glycogen debranching enzyme
MRIRSGLLIVLFAASGVRTACCQSPRQLARRILADSTLDSVKAMARALVKTGFNAGTSYGEVWIRDFNTFIDVSCEVLPRDSVKERLRRFFQLQGEDGDIVDGYIPSSRAHGGYQYIYSDNAPGLAGHKNTVETDQETSLVQAVCKYVRKTKDTAFLYESVDGKSVRARIVAALQFLMNNRYASRYGLLYGATTADWGDVQPETPWGVVMDSASHPAIDIYDNAMLVIALNDYLSLFPQSPHWRSVRHKLRANIRRYLWDSVRHKFRPHIYLDGSPFPASFDENSINYHGGTAVAIRADLLDTGEIDEVNAQMIRDVKASGAPSIGLTLYPPYPAGFFKNRGMYPYGYQNGGDWTWFGARMITALVRYGFAREAYEELKPMARRVLANHGFYEWYTREGKATGSGSFRGSAGVLYTAITALQRWAEAQVK